MPPTRTGLSAKHVLPSFPFRAWLRRRIVNSPDHPAPRRSAPLPDNRCHGMGPPSVHAAPAFPSGSRNRRTPRCPGVFPSSSSRSTGAHSCARSLHPTSDKRFRSTSSCMTTAATIRSPSTSSRIWRRKGSRSTACHRSGPPGSSIAWIAPWASISAGSGDVHDTSSPTAISTWRRRGRRLWKSTANCSTGFRASPASAPCCASPTFRKVTNCSITS